MMQSEILNQSPDLQLLQAEGYEVDIVNTFLVINNVPYLNCQQEVKFGKLFSNLELAGKQNIKTK